jgi:hypothetical protein
MMGRHPRANVPLARRHRQRTLRFDATAAMTPLQERETALTEREIRREQRRSCARKRWMRTWAAKPARAARRAGQATMSLLPTLSTRIRRVAAWIWPLDAGCCC